MALPMTIEPSPLPPFRRLPKPIAVQVPRILQLQASAPDPWRAATDRARAQAIARELIVLYINGVTASGVSQNKAIALMLSRASVGALSPNLMRALAETAKSGKLMPTRSTLCLWQASYRERGVAGLLPDYKGRVVEQSAWWGPALELFAQPSKPSMASVHKHLTEIEGFTCTYEQVAGYLSSLPATHGKFSPARIGKRLYRLTQKAYIRRSVAHMQAGDLYVADGYRADVYLAHPITGDLWRPELTVAMDLYSRCIVGWRADEHEGGYAVQNMWAECFSRHAHVPPILYIDNGSGYKNKMMDDAMVGFYARAGVAEITHSLPGNPHGKGWIERFFRTMKEDFLRMWRPEFFCGMGHNQTQNQADEVRKAIFHAVKARRLQAPSIAEFTQAFNDWLARYHSRPHPEFTERSKAECFAELLPIPPLADVAELKRRAVLLTVRRAAVRQGKREYGHPDLHGWNAQKVVLEYDIMDDQIGIIKTQDGRWICDAKLIRAVHQFDNRLEELRQIRKENQNKRLAKKAEENNARSRQVIDAASVRSIAHAVDSAVLPAPSVKTFDIDFADIE